MTYILRRSRLTLLQYFDAFIISELLSTVNDWIIFFPFWNESYHIWHIAHVVFTSSRNLQRKNSLNVSVGNDVCSRAWGLEVLHKAWQLPLILLVGITYAFGSSWNNFKWDQTKTTYPISFFFFYFMLLILTFSVVLRCVVRLLISWPVGQDNLRVTLYFRVH